MFGHFGFQFGAVGNIGRVARPGGRRGRRARQQAGCGDVGLDQLDGRYRRRCVGRSAARAAESSTAMHGRVGPVPWPARPPARRYPCTGRRSTDPSRCCNRCGRPLQQRLGLRPRDEHARPDVQRQRAERRGAGQVLQRHPLRPGGDQFLVAAEEVVGRGVEKASRPRSTPATWAASQFGVDSARSRYPPRPAMPSRLRWRHATPVRAITPAGAGSACPLRPARRAARPYRRRGPGRGCAP